MQKLLNQYTQVTLWMTIVLIIAAPVYVVYDLFLRQPDKVEALHDEYVDKGSYLFAANQCWRCHGYKGEGGIGLPLNKTDSLSAREAKDPFIFKTIARGRRGTQMPPWHKDEGGPLDTEQIKMLREFILDGTHWGSYFDEEPLLVGDKRWKLTDNFLADHNLVPPAPLSQEDRGKALFSTANCIACHNVTSETKVGPGLAGIFQKDKLPNGKPVNDDTIKEWVQKGSASYKSDPSQQPYMPPYAGVVNTDDKMADMIAYLKTLKK